MKLVMVNDTNIKDYVPDLPEEYFRLPYAAAKSDFVRAAVLYHQGGVYMDTDFLLMKPMDDVLAQLQEHEIVAYNGFEGGLPAESNSCQEYSSNWLAARKGNLFHKTWWENMRQKLTRVCGEGEMANNEEKVCCHEAFAKEPDKRSCHIPWAHLEHLKNPKSDNDLHRKAAEDTTSREILVKEHKSSLEEVEKVLQAVNDGNQKAKQIPAEAQLYCLNGIRGLAPHLNGEVYWQPWNSATQTTGELLKTQPDYKQFEDRFSCKQVNENDLECTHSQDGDHTKKPQVYKDFFNRMAYHLFFSLRTVNPETREQMLQGNWMLSEMYRRSLGVAKAASTPS